MKWKPVRNETEQRNQSPLWDPKDIERLSDEIGENQYCPVGGKHQDDVRDKIGGNIV